MHHSSCDSVSRTLLRGFAACLVLWSLRTAFLKAGEITTLTWYSGVGSVAGEFIVPPSTPNNDNVAGPSPNTIYVLQKNYVGIGPVDLVFDLTGTGGTTEYHFVEGVSNATGLASRHSRDLDRASLRAERLPGTRVEGEQIAALLQVKPWLDNVLERPLKAIRSPRILHLATHGFCLPDQPRDPEPGRRDIGFQVDRLVGARWENPLLRSGLLLAGFNTWRSGGTPPDGG